MIPKSEQAHPRGRSLYWYHVQGSFVALVLSAVLISAFFYYFSENLLTRSSKQSLREHASFRIDQIDRFVREQQRITRRLAMDQQFQQHIEEIAEQFQLYDPKFLS